MGVHQGHHARWKLRRELNVVRTPSKVRLNHALDCAVREYHVPLFHTNALLREGNCLLPQVPFLHAHVRTALRRGSAPGADEPARRTPAAPATTLTIAPISAPPGAVDHKTPPPRFPGHGRFVFIGDPLEHEAGRAMPVATPPAV